MKVAIIKNNQPAFIIDLCADKIRALTRKGYHIIGVANEMR